MNENYLISGTYSVEKLMDGSFSLRNVENPTDCVVVGKKYLANRGQRYVIGGRKLRKLKSTSDKCLKGDYCIAFNFTGEDYNCEPVKHISSQFENSKIYTVCQMGDSNTFYLDSKDRRNAIYHEITINKTYMIDSRKGWGNWRRFMRAEDLAALNEACMILAECLKTGSKVKFGINPVTNTPQVKMVAA